MLNYLQREEILMKVVQNCVSIQFNPYFIPSDDVLQKLIDCRLISSIA